MWKCRDLSITQILREIIFGDSKIQRLSSLSVMNFCTFWRLKFTNSTKFRAPIIAKMGNFWISRFSKLDYIGICKIWMTEYICMNYPQCAWWVRIKLFTFRPIFYLGSLVCYPLIIKYLEVTLLKGMDVICYY